MVLYSAFRYGRFKSDGPRVLGRSIRPYPFSGAQKGDNCIFLMAQKVAGRRRPSNVETRGPAAVPVRTPVEIKDDERPGRSLSPLHPAEFAAGALLVLATLIVYWPALRGTLLWDDAAHVTRLELRSLSGLWRIWFQLGATQQYYPLLHSAFWLEHRLWGGSVLGYHWTNVLLHAAAAIFLVLIVRRWSIRGAWLAGFLFALHPVAVNSVAWISEQKTTLSAVFYLGSALLYLNYDETRRRRTYVLALFLFLLALASKSVTATLPAALLVVLWWRRGRLDWKRDIQPLAPWFVIGAGSGLFTAWIERTYIGAQGPEFSLSALDRFLLAGRVIWFYASKLVWPRDLLFIYPHWDVDAAVWWQWLFTLSALALGGALWVVARRQRGPLAAFLFFAGTLFPVLGFLNVYPFLYSYVADHFQYLASLGVIVPAALVLAAASERLHRRVLAPIAAFSVAVIATLGVLTWRQAGIYRDSETIYRDTLRRNPGSWMAENNLGVELLDQPGRLSEAIPHFHAALALKPDSAEAHNNLGKALGQMPGRLPEAIAEYQAALRIRPRFAEAENNLGRALSQIPARAQEAIPHFQAALQMRPAFAEARTNLGVAFLDIPGRAADAVAEFETALAINPELSDAHNGLGSALSEQPGRMSDAVREFQTALKLRPDYAEAHCNLGQAFADTPERLPDAIREYQAALKIRPDYPEAHNGLGVALSKQSKRTEAIAEFEAALKTRPDYPEAHNNLGTELSQAGRLPEAIPHFEAALRSNPDSAEMHANLGNALSEIPGRWPEAVQQFQAAVRIRPDFAAAHYLLGVALARMPGRSKDALSELEQAQRLQPDPKLAELIEQIRAKPR